MPDVSFTVQEMVIALPKLWAMNPMALQQLHNIVLQDRLDAANVEIARLMVSPNGVPSEGLQETSKGA